MNRNYTNREYRALVDRIRALRSDIALTTDIIAGFCSETDAEFAETYELAEEIRFHNAFIFKYSERKHTIAARKFSDDIPEPVKAERVTRLVELQRRISLEHNRSYVGATVAVLVEGSSKRSDFQCTGKTDGNITVVWDKSLISCQPGDFVAVPILDASASTLFAHTRAESRELPLPGRL